MTALVNRRRCYTGNSGSIDYSKMYFTIESLEDNNTISIENTSGNDRTRTFYYSTDNGENWTDVIVAIGTKENIAILNEEEKVLVKSNNNDRLSNGNGGHVFSGNNNFKVYGNIMSLLRGDNFVSNPELPSTTYHFHGLFQEITTLVDAENLILPSTVLYDSSYRNMFNGCTNLVSAPQLPATTLENDCYRYMFYGCTSLTKVPSLLMAETLKPDCYRNMFDGCTSLVTAPTISASTVASSCCYAMFQNCTSLINAPQLLATTMQADCYHDMFKGCTSLVNAPELPAETLANYCYANMFEGCTALTKAPQLLPATVLADGCYRAMFKGCTSLITLPKLPATTMKKDCYASMFNGCTSIINAPALPATTLANYCYQYMFYGCTSLTTAPELPATTMKTYCYYSMFDGCISLAEAPELPATILAEGCYCCMFRMSDSEKLMTPAMTKAPILSAKNVVSACYTQMFKGNGNLNEVICLAEDTSPQSIGNSTNNWLTNCSPTGTFIRSASATGWPRTTSGIPSGWTSYSDGLLGISISGPDTIDIIEHTYSIEYNPSDTLDKYKGVTWSVVSGSATITQDGVLTPTAIGNVVIQAVSTYDSSMVATKSITVQEELPYPLQYFTIESLADSNAITIQNVNCRVTPTFYYSLNGGDTWSSVTMTQNGTQNIATINTGDKILFKSTNTSLGVDWDKYNRFNGSKNFKVQGNIMSLLYGDDFVNNPEFASTSANNFAGLFRGNTKIIDASNLILPSTTVYQNSYNSMFRDCANLVHAPELPATNLSGKGCYSSMFEGCISLVEAPELPATTLYDECYFRMFCMSRSAKLTTPAMTKSPVLPAATVETNAYKEMFKGNGNLVEITCLATNVGSNASNWVANVSSTGTFKKNANMSSWTTDTSGIPSGWTVVDYVEE